MKIILNTDMPNIIQWIPLIFVLLFTQCKPQDSSDFDVQGHRGCRGYYPENTTTGFIKAVQLGVTTLEMDVVITKDQQVLLSHEPYMSPEICLDQMGKPIADGQQSRFNIYHFTYAEIQKFDCGSKVVSRFPAQEKQIVSKPLLFDVINEVEEYVKDSNLTQVYYNIEIKSNPDTDGLFHPVPGEYVRLVVDIIHAAGIKDRVIIQSFDVRSLQEVHQNYPGIKTALLVWQDLPPQEMISQLGFTPFIYSPNHELVNSELVQFCKQQKIRLIPWTVNDRETIKKLIHLDVDGIISDYPDRVVDALSSK